MQETEAKKIIASMMVSFSNYRPVDVDYTAQEWCKYLSDYTYEQISSALKEYILTENSGFAPSIGQIANMVKKQSERKYFEELEKILLESSYSGQIEQKSKQMIESANERRQGEIKALEDKIEGVMPPTDKLEEVRRKLQDGL